MHISRRLADFAYELKYERLGKAVIGQAKKCLLDFVGVSLLGSTTKVGRTLANAMKNIGGVKESTMIGHINRIPCINAAFVNGALAHIHELDDGHRFAMGHPGAPVISAALSTAEKVNATGRELILAMVTGYEMFIRIASAINPSHLLRGFHTTGTCGSFGAAVAAGKLLNLKAKELTSALGIAGIQAAGLMEVMQGESVIKPLQPGKASQNGILAALLARDGITAPETVLEGERGFCRATSDDCELPAIAKDLGENYGILGVYFKFYASCRHIHPSIDAALKIVNRYDIHPEEIKEIHVQTYSVAYNLCGKEYEPNTVSTAKFSLPYCISVAIRERKLDPQSFTTDKIKDQDILNLARKVKIKIDPEIEKFVPKERGSKVEIVKVSGEKHKCYVKNPYGEPEVPASLQDLENKFRTLSTKVILPEKSYKLMRLIEKLETLKSVEAITVNLSQKSLINLQSK